MLLWLLCFSSRFIFCLIFKIFTLYGGFNMSICIFLDLINLFMSNNLSVEKYKYFKKQKSNFNSSFKYCYSIHFSSFVFLQCQYVPMQVVLVCVNLYSITHFLIISDVQEAWKTGRTQSSFDIQGNMIHLQGSFCLFCH